jgi:hypothetical protein
VGGEVLSAMVGSRLEVENAIAEVRRTSSANVCGVDDLF